MRHEQLTPAYLNNGARGVQHLRLFFSQRPFEVGLCCAGSGVKDYLGCGNATAFAIVPDEYQFEDIIVNERLWFNCLQCQRVTKPTTPKARPGKRNTVAVFFE
jgi:hypothetical protein